MLKILQLTTVIIFAAFVVVGFIIVFALPDAISAYRQLVDAILPAWLTSITAALLGKPITEAAASLGKGRNNGCAEKNGSNCQD